MFDIPKYRAQINDKIAEAYLYYGNLKQAKQYLDESVKIREGLNMAEIPGQMAYSSYRYADFCLKNNDLQTAI